MKKQGGDEAFKTAAGTLLKYIGNVVRAPDEDKFRNINLGNAAFQSRVGSVPGAVDFLKVVGFQVMAVGAPQAALTPSGSSHVFALGSTRHASLMMLRVPCSAIQTSTTRGNMLRGLCTGRVFVSIIMSNMPRAGAMVIELFAGLSSTSCCLLTCRKKVACLRCLVTRSTLKFSTQQEGRLTMLSQIPSLECCDCDC